MRVALYSRVSTADKDQNPDTQLLPLREFVQAQGWDAVGEFVDTASATDLRGRGRWRELLEAAAKRKIDLILVWKLDRAFRSVAHASITLQDLKRWGVGLRSYSEPWLDTSGTSPAGELMLNILVSFAQFEKALIAERVRAGMARAKKQGRVLGRPKLRLPDTFPQLNSRCWPGRYRGERPRGSSESGTRQWGGCWYEMGKRTLTDYELRIRQSHYTTVWVIPHAWQLSNTRWNKARSPLGPCGCVQSVRLRSLSG